MAQLNRIGSFTLLFLIIPLIGFSQIDWDPSMEIAGSEFDNNYPRIVTAASGTPLVVWNNGQDVLFVRWEDEGFTEPISLNPDGMKVAGASWMGPDIAAKGDSVYVVFKEKPEQDTSHHIWCVYSYDGGQNFSDPVRVDDIGEDLSRFPVVTTDDTGQPIVGYMKFEPGFDEPNWVVCTSADGGKSFSSDVLAGGWSSSTSEACDCCPGALACSGSQVAMIYRDNNSNIRDNWVGLSSNDGQSFDRGLNIDRHHWVLASCPSSGPDGVIVGDTLYSTFMNGASGNVRSYYNKTPLDATSGSKGKPLTGDIPDLSQQNYSRIAASGQTVAIVWRQYVGGNCQLPILFAEDITRGFPTDWDTVTSEIIINADVSLSKDRVFVVWEDYDSGSVKFRSGTYGSPTNSEYTGRGTTRFSAQPNPSGDRWTIRAKLPAGPLQLQLINSDGKRIYSRNLMHAGGRWTHTIENGSYSKGTYFLQISFEQERYALSLIKH